MSFYKQKCLEECSVHSKNDVSACCYVLSCSLSVLLYIIQDRNSTPTYVSTAREFIGPLTGKSSDRPNTRDSVVSLSNVLFSVLL